MSVTTKQTAVILTRTSTRELAGEVTVWTAGTIQTDLTVSGAKTTTSSSPMTTGAPPVNAIQQVKSRVTTLKKK